MTTVVGATGALRHPGPSRPRSCTNAPRGRPWSSGIPCRAAGREWPHLHLHWRWRLSTEAVHWAMYDAPRLMNDAGKPDVTARDVLFVLAEKAHADGTNAFPSSELIADVTGLDDATIRRAIRRLEDAKLIERDGKRPRGAIVWRLNMSLIRAVSHREQRTLDEAARRAATAERVRRTRANQAAEKAEKEAAKRAGAARVTVTDPVTSSADGVVVTRTDPVTSSRDGGGVTGSASACNRISVPEVTGAVPPEPRTGTTNGSGGAAARPQTPAASNLWLASVGGSPHPGLDLGSHVPCACAHEDREPPRPGRRPHLRVVGGDG